MGTQKNGSIPPDLRLIRKPSGQFGLSTSTCIRSFNGPSVNPSGLLAQTSKRAADRLGRKVSMGQAYRFSFVV